MTQYFAYDAETLYVLAKSPYKKVAVRKAEARVSRDKPYNGVKVCTAEEYAKFDTKVTRVNLMSGKEYQEDINTPLCCSPASDTYWSM